MTELEGMRAEPVPRDEAVCRAFARRIEPFGGFVAYGVLWLFFVGNALAIGGMLAGVAIADAIGAKDLAAVFGGVLAVVLAGASIVLFLLWAKRRRQRAAEFVRYAVFVDGKYTAPQRAIPTVQLKRTPRIGYGARFFRVDLLHDARRAHVLAPFLVRPEDGATVPMLVQSEVRIALAFDEDGRACPCRIRYDG